MELKAYKVNHCDYVISHLGLEQTKEVCNQEYGGYNKVEDIQEVSLNEKIYYLMGVGLDDISEPVNGEKYKYHKGNIYKEVTLREVIKLEEQCVPYQKPYVVATTEF